MLFLNLPSRELAQASWSVIDVQVRNTVFIVESGVNLRKNQVLNSITPQTDLESINFLLESANGSEMSNASLCERIGHLLVWSVTPLQYGEHRPYAVTTLLRQWKDKRDERALRRDSIADSGGNDELLQDYLFDWLDSSDVSGDSQNLSSVALLYYELIRHSLFSYTKYTQRLIARGDVGLSSTNVSLHFQYYVTIDVPLVFQETESRHRNFLRWIPLHDVSSSVYHERRAILYGTRVRETPEELNEREIRREIRSIIPELFGGMFIPLFQRRQCTKPLQAMLAWTWIRWMLY
jgi:mediator of RNA polymerase II transcription subunit 12